MSRGVGFHRDERGLIGKLSIVWLLVLGLAGVAMVDAGSIALTTFKLSDVATEAAANAAGEYRRGSSAAGACLAARGFVEATQPDVRMNRRFCLIDPATGQVTVTLKTTASTILAGRLEPTRRYTKVTASETNGPSGV